MDRDDPQTALITQSAYYLATGIAPFVSRRGFEAVTGPKREWWLVQTVGALVTVIGGVLASATVRRRITPEMQALAIGSAAALATIDIVYVTRRRVSPLYLLDAAIEISLIVGVSQSGRPGRSSAS
jgi:hypothetical protein